MFLQLTTQRVYFLPSVSHWRFAGRISFETRTLHLSSFGGPCFAGAFHFLSQTSPRALWNLVFAHSSRRSPGCRSLLRSHRDGSCSHCGTSAAARNLNFTLWLNQEGGSHILFLYFFFFLILFFFLQFFWWEGLFKAAVLVKFMVKCWRQIETATCSFNNGISFCTRSPSFHSPRLRVAPLCVSAAACSSPARALSPRW